MKSRLIHYLLGKKGEGNIQILKESFANASAGKGETGALILKGYAAERMQIESTLGAGDKKNGRENISLHKRAFFEPG